MVYLIVNETEGVCKIGHSTHPEKRLAQLQTANVNKLILRGTLEGDSFHEKFLHKKFQRQLLTGEWFILSPEITSFFDSSPVLPTKPVAHPNMAIFSNGSSWINQCRHIGEAKLFGHFLTIIKKDNQKWVLKKEYRDSICGLLALTEGSFFNYLKLLTKSGLLIKLGKGEYKINSEYISYGGNDKKSE